MASYLVEAKQGGLARTSLSPIRSPACLAEPTNGNTTTPLSPEAFSTALTADLNDVENDISNGNFYTPFQTSVAYTLADLGSGVYTDDIQLIGANGNTGLSFADQSANLITMTSSNLASYNLATVLNLSGITVTTSLGTFVTAFGGVNVPTEGAMANVTLMVTETPEPSSFLMVGMCFAAFLPVCLWRPRAALRAAHLAVDSRKRAVPRF